MARLKPHALGDAALEVLKQWGLDVVMWGDVHQLDEIAERAKPDWWRIHPLDRHQRVLAILWRDPRFEHMHIRVDLDIGRDKSVYQRRLVRGLRAKDITWHVV